MRTHLFQQQGLAYFQELDYSCYKTQVWLSGGFEWRLLCQGCLWSRWRAFVSCTAYQHCSQPCGWDSHHRFLVCREFSFASWLEGLIDAQRALTGSVFLYLHPSFFFTDVQCTRCVFASPVFRLCIPFLWVPEQGVGQDSSEYPEWANTCHVPLRSKPKSCYGKVNKYVIWQFTPVSLWESFSRDLRVNQLST